jgi:hypothetical protein
MAVGQTSKLSPKHILQKSATPANEIVGLLYGSMHGGSQGCLAKTILGGRVKPRLEIVP